MRRRSSTSLSRRLSVFRTGVITLVLLLVIGGISHSIFKTYQRRYEVEQEKQEFEAQIEQIRQESAELEKIQQIVSTDSYQEREAKEKLDLDRPGEEVVVVSPASIVDALDDENLVRILKEPKSEEVLKAQTNPEKWWAFFFDKQRL